MEAAKGQKSPHSLMGDLISRANEKNIPLALVMGGAFTPLAVLMEHFFVSSANGMSQKADVKKW